MPLAGTATGRGRFFPEAPRPACDVRILRSRVGSRMPGAVPLESSSQPSGASIARIWSLPGEELRAALESRAQVLQESRTELRARAGRDLDAAGPARPGIRRGPAIDARRAGRTADRGAQGEPARLCGHRHPAQRGKANRHQQNTHREPLIKRREPARVDAERASAVLILSPAAGASQAALAHRCPGTPGPCGCRHSWPSWCVPPGVTVQVSFGLPAAERGRPDRWPKKGMPDREPGTGRAHRLGRRADGQV
jgi:hypothetical protein